MLLPLHYIHKTILCMACLLIASCNGRQKLATTRAEAEDTLGITSEEDFEARLLTAQELAARRIMPQELDNKALQDIRLAIASADTADLQYFFTSFEGDDSDPALYAVMQRVMRLDVTYDGPHFYAHLWACEDAVSSYLQKYLQTKPQNIYANSIEVSPSVPPTGKTKHSPTIYDLILKELHPILEYYGASEYQSDMNTVALTEATLITYKTIATFKDLMAQCQHSATRKAYFLDFALWYDTYLATSDRHYGHYAMWRMETSYYLMEMMNLRCRFLQEEMRFLHAEQPSSTTMPADSVGGGIAPIDWDTEDADLIRQWYDLRMTQAPNISHDLDPTLYRKITDHITSSLIRNLHFNTFMYEDNSDPSADNTVTNIIE